jgi:hypothetical protein
MLHARNKQRFGNNYMMTVQTMYFSSSLDDNADTNGTSKLVLLITDMDNFYFMTDGMKGRATCVFRYERKSVTADIHKVPQNTLPSVTTDVALEFNGSAHWPFRNKCSTQSEMWSVEKTYLLTLIIHDHTICKSVLFAGGGYLTSAPGRPRTLCSVKECMELYLLSPLLHDP